ncbi:LytR/AlgR family response regulator transcription factor [Lapidilactobacillus mulanensis]|uniref:LytR/AlgR family response regulator transcription factor n=1 Tax=Lapidilactobacillus mulanensis TaxID=2485999 RepID=A0ABW4DPD7_9LACO|nr:LytTR family DNA-binding domain-containing protein [Lapidilactobacillus mulanensis]
MKIAIVEDNHQTQQQIITLLTAIDSASQPINATCFNSGEAFLFEFSETQNFDLILLDIQLGGQDGMTVARKIRKSDPQVALAFLSNYDDYVFDGYDVGALGYIMKPLTADKLTALLQKVELQTQVAYFLAEIDNESIKIPLFDIIYFEVQNHQINIHTQTKTYQINAQLKEIQPQLTADFIQIYRSLIVNLSFISQLTNNALTLNDGTTLPVSRQQHTPVKQAFLAHYRGLAHDDLF